MSRSASRRRRDGFIAVVGALALAVAAAALAVVESRPSHESPLRPHGVAVQAAGSFTRAEGEGTVLPGGACLPEPPATACRPPSTQIEWRLDGLPPAPAGGRYAAFLGHGDAPRALGPFVAVNGQHVLEQTAEEDGGATHILLVLTHDATSYGGLLLHEAALDALDAPFQAAPPGAGTVRLDQIGAVSVSLLAAAELDAPAVPGLVYRAWLDEGGPAQYLGALDVQGGRKVLDVRIERLHVPEEGRVLVTLESQEVGSGPAGFPAYVAQLGT